MPFAPLPSLAFGRKLDVKVSEPDVYPLAVQGPKAEKLLTEIFGPHVKNIEFFKFDWIDVNGSSQLIARSGYSRQGGFEIYLKGKAHANFLWDIIWKKGQHDRSTIRHPYDALRHDARRR